MIRNIGISTPSKKDVEEHEVQRAEHADHQGLEHQEGDHVLLDPVLMASQLARMQIGVRSVDSSTKGMEMPSTPMW